MSKPFSHRHEMLFLYEAVDCNPNGDPLDENRPRTDPRTGVCTVTDVRIKRTIRDEILSWEPDEKQRLENGQEILIRDTFVNDGSLATGKDRAEAFGKVSAKPKPEEVRQIQKKVLDACIDARLFGSTLPIGKGDAGASLKLTGPVQFSLFSRSLHRVSPQLVQMTAAFAGKAGAAQKSFAERHLLPYALVAVRGIANEVAARATGASDDDLLCLLWALWDGTNHLATTSKMGHASLLLLDIEYLDGNVIGRLEDFLTLVSDQADEDIRSTRDFQLDVSRLVAAVARERHRIAKASVRRNERLRVFADGKEASLLDLLSEAKVPAEHFALAEERGDD